VQITWISEIYGTQRSNFLQNLVVIQFIPEFVIPKFNLFKSLLLQISASSKSITYYNIWYLKIHLIFQNLVFKNSTYSKTWYSKIQLAPKPSQNFSSILNQAVKTPP